MVPAGCGGGGGGGGGATTTSTTAAAVTTSSTVSASIGSIVNTTTTAHSVTSLSTRSSKEEQSGDELPISTQALFTGKGGRISPAKVEVPPFIAVTVVLRSADGRTYDLEGPRRGLATTGKAQMKLAGLRAGNRYVLKSRESPGKLVIEANAEPGP